MKRFIFVLLIIALFIPIIAEAQLKDPAVPRSWWDELKTWIVQLTDYQPMIFLRDSLIISPDVVDTLAVWTFHRATQIQEVELSLESLTTFDSTRIFIMHSTGADTIISIPADTSAGYGASGGIKHLLNSTAVNIAAASSCTLVVQSFVGSDNTFIDFALSIFSKTRTY